MREVGQITIAGKTIDNHEQKFLDDHFDAQSTFWRDTYQRNDAHGVIVKHRKAIALKYVDELALSKTARILEIGCGAGFVATALAQRGYTVHAVDSVPAMVELTQRHAKQKCVENRVHATIGDVNELRFDNESFDLVVALGLVCWLQDLRKALVEIARVLTTNGHFILSMNNKYGAILLLDPLMTPGFRIMRKCVKRVLEKANLLNQQHGHSIYTHSIKEFIQYLSESNLTCIKYANFGFGPFTIFGHKIFPDGLGVKIQQKLQKHADNGCPIIGSLGFQYIVLGEKGNILK